MMCFLDKNLLPQRNRVKDITNTLNEEWTLVFLIFFILTVVSSKFSFKILEFCFFTDSYRIVVTSLFCLSHYAILALFDSNKKDARDQFLLQYFQNKKKSYIKFTKAACWVISKISNRENSIKLIILKCCLYCWSLFYCNYWRSLILQNSTFRNSLKVAVQSRLILHKLVLLYWIWNYK